MLNNILIALAVVGAVGLIAGILLALISHFFAVPDDEKVKAVRACLPGINCGACGYKGCDDYAVAVAEGEAKANLCVPGAADVAKELGELLGIEVEAPKDVVAFVHCNGTCEATTKRAEYDGISSCKAASMLYGGPDACSYGCMGLGDCATSCPADAICMKDGVARVDTTRCLGCGLCETICPKNIISMVPQETSVVVMCSNKDKGADARKVCTNVCIGCKKCEKTCPNGAITVVNNLAEIDYDKCTGCALCVSECPTKCLKHVFFPDLSESVEEILANE
ncbi:MAG: RnfABCDGE type electron transport complex subunit B [Ruminococcaceae bacterium]|nr:RnfABCDGE type electron transport complex subunit B [Oscillospiraceae bacterium]